MVITVLVQWHKKQENTKICPTIHHRHPWTLRITTSETHSILAPTHIITTSANIKEYGKGEAAYFIVCTINNQMCKQNCSAHSRQNTQL